MIEPKDFIDKNLSYENINKENISIKNSDFYSLNVQYQKY